MPIKLFTKNEQATGSFNNGEILENKPIGFLHEGGKLRPYSNLFYWAHAWAETESTIGEHPHKGFEIMSFVLEGSIEHYDSKIKDWITLNKGDVQIIRAGSGISHAEKLNKGAHIFQIWFDPNLRKTFNQNATYNDYKDGDFPAITQNQIQKIIYKGDKAPIQMETEGILIEKWMITKGEFTLQLNEQNTVSAYCLNDSFKIGNKTMHMNDFALINDEKSIQLSTEMPIELFVIISPTKVSYATYSSSN